MERQWRDTEVRRGTEVQRGMKRQKGVERCRDTEKIAQRGTAMWDRQSHIHSVVDKN